LVTDSNTRPNIGQVTKNASLQVGELAVGVTLGRDVPDLFRVDSVNAHNFEGLDAAGEEVNQPKVAGLADVVSVGAVPGVSVNGGSVISASIAMAFVDGVSIAGVSVAQEHARKDRGVVNVIGANG
jgi:hypothetical protein